MKNMLAYFLSNLHFFILNGISLFLVVGFDYSVLICVVFKTQRHILKDKNIIMTCKTK